MRRNDEKSQEADMRVASLEACTCVVPLERGAAIATRAIRERHYTLVRVRTDTGAEGVGFSYNGTRAGRLVTLAVRELLRDEVVGQDPHQAEAIWDKMYREALLQGRRGAVLRAISAVDIALWDAVSKEAGLPLYRYLGTDRADTVPAYASGGYYKEGKDLDELAREMQDYLDMGFRAVKMKLGGLPPEEDAPRVKAVREAVGPDVPVFLDANNAWPDAQSAIHAVRVFEDYDPGWIEEPLMPDDVSGHAQVAASVKTPVATGEIHATLWEFQDLVRQRAASILQPDAGVCGGITELRRIAAMAESHDIPVAPHWLAEVHVHMVAATPKRHLGRVLHRPPGTQPGQALQHEPGGETGRPGPATGAGPGRGARRDRGGPVHRGRVGVRGTQNRPCRLPPTPSWMKTSTLFTHPP